MPPLYLWYASLFPYLCILPDPFQFFQSRLLQQPDGNTPLIDFGEPDEPEPEEEDKDEAAQSDTQDPAKPTAEMKESQNESSDSLSAKKTEMKETQIEDIQVYFFAWTARV